MSNDGTGLREALTMALQHIRICAPDPTVDAALESALTALSAVAPPPVLEGMEDAVAAVAGAIWFAAGDEGYLMGSGPFLNAHPDDQAAMKRIASAAIKESLTVAMLAASPAAPAQAEMQAAPIAWEMLSPRGTVTEVVWTVRDRDDYLSEGWSVETSLAALPPPPTGE